MKRILLLMTILITLMPVELISTKECYGQSAEIQRLQQEIRNLSVQAMEAYNNNKIQEFNRLSQKIKEMRAQLEQLQRRGFDPDEDHNGCIDAGEANRYELITGSRYTGPLPRCGPDEPRW